MEKGEKVKVMALKAFAVGGSIVGPGEVEVPAGKVARLVEKGLIVDPAGGGNSGGGGAQAQANKGEAQTAAALARLGSALSLERGKGEEAHVFIERAARHLEKAKQGARTGGGGGGGNGGGGSDVLPATFPVVARLKEVGVTTLVQLASKSDADLVKAGFKEAELKEIRAAEKALTK